jgi:hypothetical protein
MALLGFADSDSETDADREKGSETKMRPAPAAVVLVRVSARVHDAPENSSTCTGTCTAAVGVAIGIDVGGPAGGGESVLSRQKTGGGWPGRRRSGDPPPTMDSPVFVPLPISLA